MSRISLKHTACVLLTLFTVAAVAPPVLARGSREGKQNGSRPGVRPVERTARGSWRDEVRRGLRGAGVEARVEHYFSKVDGERRPYGICVTDPSSTPKPLVVVVNPGASSDGDGDALLAGAEEMAWYAVKNGRACVVIRPSGRGPGSLYQNYGEVDVLEAIEDVMSKHPIDRDRIVLIGHSMGGAATWYLISHYPDVFAAGAPLSGYCDYRLWNKPGGYAFPMQPWEEPSWKSRSAAFLVENFQHTPVWIVHGEWDRGVGSGVPVAHSRRMASLLKEQGYSYKYTEVPQTGHHFGDRALIEEVVLWLLEQKKERKPRCVRLATYGPRHNKAYWVRIDQLERYDARAFVEGCAERDGSLVVSTVNVRTLTLGPLPQWSAAKLDVRIDGQPAGILTPGNSVTFRRSQSGAWTPMNFEIKNEKHHGQSGPLGDLFFENVILVQGSVGSAEETFFNTMMVHNTSALFRQTNGGVHRGGIQGQNSVNLQSARDVDLSEEEIRSSNLLLFGSPSSNALIKRFADSLPVRFGPNTIQIYDRQFSGDQLAMIAVFPHPLNPGRYLAIHGGTTPDAVTYGSHLNLLLLPDYLVYDGDRIVDWGFWDNDWKFSRN